MPPFSRVVGSIIPREPAPYVELTELGMMISRQIESLHNKGPFIIKSFVIMPDHIHILWDVCGVLKMSFAWHVGQLKSSCTREWRKSRLAPTTDAPLFTPNFNDRIVNDLQTGQIIRNYILDNPRRLLIRIERPDLFQRRQRVCISGREMVFYGNFQLLKNPFIVPAIISRAHSPEERMRLERLWDDVINHGGVLVSPFISQDERTLMKRGIEGNASIIRIIPDGLGERYKPSGKEFELCAEGRCLHIGEPKTDLAQHKLTRSESLRHNELAQWIAENANGIMKILKTPDIKSNITETHN